MYVYLVEYLLTIFGGIEFFRINPKVEKFFYSLSINCSND
jgi:hypothetical protein